MTVVRVKGFQIFKDRHGRQRCYHRKTREKIDLVRFPIGTEGFFAECQRITAVADKAAAVARPGTLGGLIAEYRQRGPFQDLAPRTRADYDRWFEYLRPIWDTPLVRFEGKRGPPLVARIMDKAASKHGRRGGNYVRTVLSVGFSYGASRGHIAGNPAASVKPIKRPRTAPQANRPWTDLERFTVLDAAPWHLKVPIALAMYLGLREGDALKASKRTYDGRSIALRTSKTGSMIATRVPEDLRQILDDAPATDATTLAANSRGIPWTDSGFRASWRTFRQTLEKAGAIEPGLTIHGLRHTRSTLIREAGFDDRTAADALGQATEAMARRYNRHADVSQKLDSVVVKLDQIEAEKRTKLSNHPRKTVKPDGGGQ